MKRILNALVLCLVGFNLNAQNPSVLFAPIMEEFKEAKFFPIPIAQGHIAENYTALDLKPLESTKQKWQLALKHNNKNVIILLNVEHDMMYIEEYKSKSTLEECGCSGLEGDDNTQKLGEKLRADNVYIAMGNNCDSRYLYKRAINITLSGNSGIASITYIFEDTDSNLEEVNALFYKFKFSYTGEYNTAGLGLGFAFDYKVRLWMVTGIAIDKPAYTAGIRPNDLIVAVNGEDPTFYDNAEMRLKLGGETNSDIELSIQRGSFTYNEKITRQELGNVGELKMLNYRDFPYEDYVLIYHLKTNMVKGFETMKGDFIEEERVDYAKITQQRYKAKYNLNNGAEGVITKTIYDNVEYGTSITMTYKDFEIGDKEEIVKKTVSIIEQFEIVLGSYYIKTTPDIDFARDGGSVKYETKYPDLLGDVEISYGYRGVDVDNYGISVIVGMFDR